MSVSKLVTTVPRKGTGKPSAKVSIKYNPLQRPLLGLCWRCEHRARFHEEGHRPRYECGEVKTAKVACYAYLPTRPYTVKVVEGDKRIPFGPGMVSARVEVVEVCTTLKATRKKERNKLTLLWNDNSKGTLY